MNQSQDKDFAAQLRRQAKDMRKKARWHIARAGSGGSYKEADRLMSKADQYDAQASLIEGVVA